MTKKKTTAPEYVIREILKEEISASEQRLDAKIDSKVDGRLNPCKTTPTAVSTGLTQELMRSIPK